MQHFFISTIIMLATSGTLGHSTQPAISQPIPQIPPHTDLPVVEYKAKPSKHFRATVFGYSSTVGQTDASPFTTASGSQVRDGIIATNCLPFGTKVKIPALFGNKEFTVTDRMAAWHGCNSVDIWYTTTAAAKQFGRRTADIEVY